MRVRLALKHVIMKLAGAVVALVLFEYFQED